jgi:hypothetical protein
MCLGVAALGAAGAAASARATKSRVPHPARSAPARRPADDRFRLLKFRARLQERRAATQGIWHRVATEPYRRTKDLALLKDFLGHANITVTGCFYGGTNEDQIKREVLAAIDGGLVEA